MLLLADKIHSLLRQNSFHHQVTKKIKNKNRGNGWVLRFSQRKAAVNTLPKYKLRFEGTVGKAIKRLLLGLLVFTEVLLNAHARSDEPEVYQMNISAQSVAESLMSLSEQTDVLLLFPYDDASKLKANPVHGKYTLLQALEIMLEGTGFSGSLSKKGVVMISLTKSDDDNNKRKAKGKNKVNSKKNIWAALMGFFVGMGGQAVLAKESEVQMEEIIVTAQKRTQNLQDVPIAITALSSQTLDNLGISESQDIPLAAPGLHFARQSAGAVVFLRGVGNSNAVIGNEASVAMYIDGVYSPFPNTNMMMFNNVERIEVLRGPQGTLFGRNATGGLIHVITKEPESEPFLDAQLGYANYNTRSVDVYGTVGIGEHLAADLAIAYQDQDEGFYFNSFQNEDYLPPRDLAVRSTWLFDLAESTSLKLSAFTVDSEGSQGLPRQPEPGTLGLGGQAFSGDFYTLPSTTSHFFEQESDGISGKFEHEFANFTFVSITGWKDEHQFYRYDQDSVIAEVILVDLDYFSESISQEFQFISNNDSQLQWLLGFYYLDLEMRADPVPIQLFGSPSSPIVINSKQVTTSTAVFGEANWSFTEATALTLGLRYTKDELDFTGITTFGSAETSPGPWNEEASFDELTWRLGLEQQFSSYDTLAYTTFSRGYKAGVYNLLTTSGVPADPVEPEILDAYELGIKSSLLDKRLRLNIAAFYYDYSDIQVAQVVSGGTINSNAAAATIYGLEIESDYSASESFSFQFGLSLLNTEYDEFSNGPTITLNPAGGGTSGSADLSGNSLVRSPELTFNAAATYTLPTKVGDIDFTANYYYNDGFFWEVENRLAQDSYELVNAQITWISPGETYSVKLWGRNLLDEEYGIYGASAFFGDLISPAEPVTYGVTIGLSF